MRIGQVYCTGTRREILCESLHGHPDEDHEVGPDEVVVIDPAAFALSRKESQRLGSSGEIPEFDFYSTSTVN